MAGGRKEGKVPFMALGIDRDLTLKAEVMNRTAWQHILA